MPTKSESIITTDHDEIQRWAEERGAQPSCVRGTGRSGDIGMLRLDFPGYSGQRSLEHISWDEWFEEFEQSNLALLYQDSTASGRRSNFNKLVDRATAEQGAGGSRSSRGRTSPRKLAKSRSAPARGGSQARPSTGKAGAGSRSRAASHTSSASKGASTSRTASPKTKSTASAKIRNRRTR